MEKVFSTAWKKHSFEWFFVILHKKFCFPLSKHIANKVYQQLQLELFNNMNKMQFYFNKFGFKVVEKFYMS
ncbi:hypothetical protein B9C88_06850 [Brevibacillus laterosporus]|nr:hypothetical protein B9C88_06850 [Brevibacillus laterosporus]CCF12331.1 hypothetical protein BLGI_202 [Brevibacillus laterosporus GI-9]